MKYLDYKNMYVVDSYERYGMFDTVIFESRNLDDALFFMDENELWEDYQVLRVDSEGNATSYLTV